MLDNAMSHDQQPGHRDARDEHRPIVEAEVMRIPPRWRATVTLGIGRVLVIVVVLASWQLTSGRVLSSFWVSSPTGVLDRLRQWLSDESPHATVWDSTLLFNLRITVVEALYGFVFGAVAAILVGVLLGRLPWLGRLLDPFILAMYSLPKIALAPLVILWFGIGELSKIVLAASVVFFMVFWNTYIGVKQTDSDLVDVVRIMGAGRLAVVRKVVFPGSLVWIFAGLSASAPYAVVGAVVGEFIASNRGIGYLLVQSSSTFDTAGTFAALIVLMLITVCIHQALSFLERRLLRWKVSEANTIL